MGLQQDTETHILGSGFLTFEWYLRMSAEWEYDADVNAPDGWSTTLTMLDGVHEDEDKTIDVVVDHGRLIDAMQRIADSEVKNVSPACKRECVVFLNDPDDADFDACTADEVLQVLAYSEVVYG